MKTARLFRNGRSQAVRLPREFAMPGAEVYVRRVGTLVVLVPKDDPWAVLASSLEQLSDDFLADRAQPPTQQREGL